MGKTFGVFAVLIFIALPAIIWIFGQLNFFAGRRPEDLGPRDGLLRPPMKGWRNVVSSQAGLHEHEPHQLIAPLAYTGTGQVAMQKLLRVLQGMKGAAVVTVEPNYIHAEFKSLLLNMVDDAEFLLDESASVIHMRSGSRLNRKDFGANRARLETIRARFNTIA
jgi:uncharacterized protein (DUF1499 family)